LVFFLTSLWPVCAVELGRVGAVYPIAEKDALSEIEQRAKNFDWTKIFNKEKNTAKLKAYRPSDMEVLPSALEDSIRTVDMTYTTEFDVPDGRGNILYPKGYVFNPSNTFICRTCSSSSTAARRTR
jgi:conjugal transfer pilus assembly protein TraW